MGGAKFMGRDKGIPHSKELTALEYTWYWFIGGLPICFFLLALISPTPNFIISILVYIIGLILLFWRYLIIDKKGMKKNG